MHQKLVYTLVFSSISIILSAQTITGVISDDAGEPLPYVTVSLPDGSKGVTSAEDGRYSISLSALEEATLEYRFIGYTLVRQIVDLSLGDQRIDVQLIPATYQLEAATISSNAEDPAYRIMREAAARREEYLRKDARYEVDVYVKGQVKVVRAPEKILGQEIGDMGGILDTSRAGIVYLSETYSTLSFEQPDKYFEKIKASRVSGDPRGYSFNTAIGINFDLYQRVTDYQKPILSPIAKSATQLYNFELLGSRRTAEGKLIHRISIKTKSDFSPGYLGEVYIEEGSFHLVDADLYLLGKALQSQGLDTLFIRQSYRENQAGNWEVYQRSVKPVISLFNFVFNGVFTAIYTNYDYTPDWSESPFGAVESEIDAQSNRVDSSIWELRPIPLTRAEQLDYVRKDSIQKRINSPAYKDSIEAKQNKFDVSSILGYEHKNWRKGTRWQYGLEAGEGGFTPVTGGLFGVGLAFAKTRVDHPSDTLSIKNLGRRFKAETNVLYGVADKRIYGYLAAEVRLEEIYNQTLRVEAGRGLRDYHSGQPVDEFWGSVYNLFAHRNPRKLMQRSYVELTHQTALARRKKQHKVVAPWATLAHTLRLERRDARAIASEYSLFKKDRFYRANFPLRNQPISLTLVDSFTTQTLFSYRGQLSYTPGVKYRIRPDGYTASSSAVPTLNLKWRTAAGTADRENIGFALLSIEARKEQQRLGRIGLLSYSLSGGIAYQFSNRSFGHSQNFKQFAGSELFINGYADYLNRYLALDHYEMRTTDPWVASVVEFDFNGFLWRRLPLIRKLGWSIIGRAATIQQVESDRLLLPYQHAEVGWAINNIGFGFARFVRFDMLWDYRFESERLGLNSATWSKPIYRLGINVPVTSLLENGEIAVGE